MYLPPFLFLSSSQPWIYELANGISRTGSIIKQLLFRDLLAWIKQPDPPFINCIVESRQVILPPGYAGKFEFLFRPLLKNIILHSFNRLYDSCHRQPFVFVPYPYLLPWLDDIDPSRIIYANYDDYGLYQPSIADEIYLKESELISKARIVLCSSLSQVNRLRLENPDSTSKIHHFPHGATPVNRFKYISTLPLFPNSVGYIGNLIDRVDWELVIQTAQRATMLNFYFIGRYTTQGAISLENWKDIRSRAFDLDNVHYIGEIRHDQVKFWYDSFSVNWMPYDIDHPFNFASSPTKIMDCLSSVKPFVSTKIPECSLYPEYITIVRDSVEASKILKGFCAQTIPHDSRSQLFFAEKNSWEARALSLQSLLRKV